MWGHSRKVQSHQTQNPPDVPASRNCDEYMFVGDKPPTIMFSYSHLSRLWENWYNTLNYTSDSSDFTTDVLSVSLLGSSPEFHIAFVICLHNFFHCGLVPQSLTLFHALDTLEEHWLGILWNVPNLGFAWCLVLIKVLLFFGKTSTELMYPAQCTASGGTWYWVDPLSHFIYLFIYSIIYPFHSPQW
jgi:hypothetical protein